MKLFNVANSVRKTGKQCRVDRQPSSQFLRAESVGKICKNAYLLNHHASPSPLFGHLVLTGASMHLIRGDDRVPNLLTKIPYT